MATTKAPSVQAILDALRRHPNGTAAELAEAAAIGRSTASKALAVLEAEGHVTRQRSTPSPGAKNAPDRWSLASQTLTGATDADGMPIPEAQPTGSRPAPEQPATTPVEAADQPDAARAPQPATAPRSETEKTTTPIDAGGKATPPAANQAVAGGPRLRPGELRSLIHAYLTERPGQELTPTKIGKDLGRSAGAVGNALATMTDAGEVTETSAKPRKYMLAAPPSQSTDSSDSPAKAS